MYLTTIEAFEHLTSKKGWYKQCGINPDTARSFKRHFKKSNLKEGKMVELLRKAGYVETPVRWDCLK